MFSAQTGHLLAMDEAGVAGAQVTGGLVERIPVLGPALSRMLLNGETVGAATLSRFYVLHILVLPVVLVAGILLHGVSVWTHGLSPRTDVGKMEVASVPVFPTHLRRLITVLFLSFGIHVAVSAFLPPGLGAKGDWMTSPAGVKPAWYFLGPYQLLHFTPDWLESWLLLLGPLLLAAVPWLDRGPSRDPRERRIPTAIALLLLGVLALLTWMGARAA
jgi:quinol-cytochrome oxidoreductase complex cytochrome b subunit